MVWLKCTKCEAYDEHEGWCQRRAPTRATAADVAADSRLEVGQAVWPIMVECGGCCEGIPLPREASNVEPFPGGKKSMKLD
jgi:hypothetical protein